MLNKPYFHDLRNYLVTHIISGKEESGEFFVYMSRKRLRNLICKKTRFFLIFINFISKFAH